MIQLVFGQDRAVCEWFTDTTGHIVAHPFVAIGGTRDGINLCGAALFNDYNASNIEIHLHAPGCMTRGTIRALAGYVFGQLGCVRLTARPHRSNKQLRQLLPRLGFEFEGVMKNFYGLNKNNDAMVYRLDRAKAERWFNA